MNNKDHINLNNGYSNSVARELERCCDEITNYMSHELNEAQQIFMDNIINRILKLREYTYQIEFLTENHKSLKN